MYLESRPFQNYQKPETLMSVVFNFEEKKCELHENYEALKEDDKESVGKGKTFSNVRRFQKILY